MDPVIGSAALSVGGSVGGGLINALTAKRRAAREFKYNKALMQYQNEYNSPKNQVARLEEAGLNPALMYGGGGAISGNLTGNLPQYNEDPTNVDLGVSEALKATQIVFQQRLQQAQIDKIYQDKAASVVQMAGQAILNDINATRNLKEAFEYSQMNKLAPYNLEIKKQAANEAAQNALNAVGLGKLRDQELDNKKFQQAEIIADIALKVTEQQKQAKLLEMLHNGIVPGDPLLLRVINSIMNEKGIKSYSELLDLFKPEFKTKLQIPGKK